MAILTTTVLSVLVGLISIGSPVAFNDVVSLTLVGLYASYFVACALLLWRRITGSIKTPDQVSSRDQSHPSNSNLPGSAGKLTWGPWRVPGFLGTLINAFGCVYLLIVGTFAFFPPTKEVNGATMNYSSLVMGSVTIFSAAYYVFWAHGYDGPIIETRSIS